jgi:hypothetical protein
MKKIVFFTLILAGAFFSATATEKPRVSRTLMALMEKSMDDRCQNLWSDNPFVLVDGNARSVYLEGYGVIFTAAVNLVTSPTLTFRPAITKTEIQDHRRKKIERLPQLKAEMKKALADFAASLDPVPADEQIVIAVLLTRYPWEDLTGIPSELTFQGQKKKLLEAKAAGGAGLDTVIHVTEN